ncbi:MAG: glycosyltransferase family 1 protein [Xenococcaceae cyanobacterium MO_188.B19]|nr:glycosyltransferase family 1 protein [Xenococcaceae cyanobacterium MO_188.B19]
MNNELNSLLFNLAMVFDKPTGIANYAINVANHLSYLTPTLLIAKSIENFSCYQIPDNMTPAQGSKGHLHRLLWTQFQLPQIYQQLKANLIYSPIPEAPLYSKCSYVVMCHDLIPLRFPVNTSPLTNYFRFVVPLVLKQAQHIICNSEATAKDITDFYGISPQKITPILLAYDEQTFYPKPTVSSESYFLYLGRHDPYKNLQRLITAFAAIADKKDYYLYIGGSTDSRFTPLLKQQAAELNILHRVKFLDYISETDLPIIISNAIALVFPTLWEGFGLPVLEAMACGTPVITSQLASLPEVTGDAAILIDPYNTEAISSAMEWVATDSQARSQLSNLGLERAKLFSWSKTGKATSEVLARYM